jgi:hypothetical protein
MEVNLFHGEDEIIGKELGTLKPPSEIRKWGCFSRWSHRSFWWTGGRNVVDLLMLTEAVRCNTTLGANGDI